MGRERRSGWRVKDGDRREGWMRVWVWVWLEEAEKNTEPECKTRASSVVCTFCRHVFSGCRLYVLQTLLAPHTGPDVSPACLVLPDKLMLYARQEKIGAITKQSLNGAEGYKIYLNKIIGCRKPLIKP